MAVSYISDDKTSGSGKIMLVNASNHIGSSLTA
jgi:hypothetical protein